MTLKMNRNCLLAMLPAVAFFVLIVDTDSAHADAYTECIKFPAPYKQNTIKACSEIIEKGSQYSSLLGEAHRNRGVAYMKKHDHSAGKKALDDISTAIRLNPRDYVAFQLRARIYSTKTWRPDTDLKQAISDISSAIELNPKNDKRSKKSAIKYLNFRSSYYLQFKNYDAAMKDAESILELDMFGASGYMRKAAIYEDMGKFDEALDNLDLANSDTDNPDLLALIARAKLHEKMDNKELAIADWQKIKKIQKKWRMPVVPYKKVDETLKRLSQ